MAYFKSKTPTRGLAKFQTDFDGATYRFANQANLDTFKTNPNQYAPQYGGYCAFGAALGKKFDGDPTLWKVVDGKLYLNLDPDIQMKWEQDIPGNLRKADAQWPKIRNKAAMDVN